MDNGSTARPHSLIFTLFGDYIHHHSDRIRISSLIKLLALFGLSEQAVRSTVSRMARSGWLKNERVGNISYYALTPQSRKLIEEGAERIFHFPLQSEKWDGCWYLVTYSIPEEQRKARDGFRGELNWMGYGMLTNTVWISPRNNRARVEQLAEKLNIKPYVQMFSGHMEAFVSCQEIAARCWNLSAINAAYTSFIENQSALLHNMEQQIFARAAIEESEFFARRFTLIHEYRRFPFRDPNLPCELLPQDWRGFEAAQLFQKYHQLLAEPAKKYFESVFE